MARAGVRIGARATVVGVAGGGGVALALLHGGPVDLSVVGVLVVAELVARMVDADDAAGNGGAANVVDGEVGAALVFVLEPTEAARLAGFLVAGKLDEDGLAKLREYGDDVALGQVQRQAAKVDEGGVAVVDVPRGVGSAGGQ